MSKAKSIREAAEETLKPTEFAIREFATFSARRGASLQMRKDGTVALTITFGIDDAGNNLRDGEASPDTGFGVWGIFNKNNANHLVDAPTNELVMRLITSTNPSREADVIADVRLLTDGEKRESGHAARQR